MPDFIQTADWAVLHWIRENLHCGALDFLMPKLTLLGEGGAVWIVAGLALTASKKYRKHGICLLLALLAGLLLCNIGLKNIVARPRPCWLEAQQITDEAFAQICTVIRPGMTEREIAAELIYRMLRLGAEGTSFDPIVLTGPDTSMPHGVPGDRRVAAGDFVTMDFGCRKNGYCSDMTRTVAVGIPTDEMRSVYQTVLNAQLAGIAAAKAGVTGERVDAAARKVISDAGYGDYFGHSFGHSLGLDIHEHPIAAPGVHGRLPEHTVISAEPGIYLPGKFGVRIEDVMHLTADGAEILTRSPKNLIIL